MDPATLMLLGLGTSAIGAGGQAFLGTQAANDANREAKKSREEQIRQFNLQFGLQQEAQPYQQADALANLRRFISQPNDYDFLSAISSRYGGGKA